MGVKEKFLCAALDIFKNMIESGECSKQDIDYFCGFSKRELNHRGASVGKKLWLTKDEAGEMLGVSTSTFDRLVLKGVLPRGRKIPRQKNLLWKSEQVEQYKALMLLKGKH